MTYATPQALRAALTSVARHHARRNGLSPSELVDRFYFQRLLARVFSHDSRGWLLKGGQALLVRYPAARHSRDIDLYRPDAASIDDAVRALVEAANVNLDDHQRYTLRKRTAIIEEGINARLTFAVSAGTKSAGSINVDVVVGLSPQGEPVRRKLEPAVPLGWPDDWPTVTLYPITDHLADKICALYERHGPARIPSTRYRDLVDILLVALEEPLTGNSYRPPSATKSPDDTDSAPTSNYPRPSESPTARTGQADIAVLPRMSPPCVSSTPSTKPASSQGRFSIQCWMPTDRVWKPRS